MDDREFAEIVNKTKWIVLSTIKKYQPARFHHAIDDVVQETYIRAYKSLKRKKFREQSSMETWLYTIAKNESLRMTKKLSREEEKLKNASEELIFSARGVWFRRSEAKEAQTTHMKNLVKDLPEIYRDVIELITLGFSENQISERLAIKRGTVKSRASRGRELMQSMVKGGVEL